jgi:hypothetical protein
MRTGPKISIRTQMIGQAAGARYANSDAPLPTESRAHGHAYSRGGPHDVICCAAPFILPSQAQRAMVGNRFYFAPLSLIMTFSKKRRLRDSDGDASRNSK